MSEILNQNQETTVVNKSLTKLPFPHLTGMKLQADIVLGDFVFNTVDEYGVIWVITDIEGWWQHPDTDIPDIPRGLTDGSYDVKGRYRARILALTGSFLTPTPDLVEAARDRLIAATNLVYKGAWLKTGTASDNKRSSFVRLSGQPEIRTVQARGRTDFTIGLKAADPIKYAWNDSNPDGYVISEIPAANRTTGTLGLETITNAGNVAVPIALEISGPITGPAKIYNKTTDKLLYVISSLRGRVTSSIVNKQSSFDATLIDDVATLTTTTPHQLAVGDNVDVSGLSEEYLNGTVTVASVPTSTTFTYILPSTVSSVKNVVSKKLVSNVATIGTSVAHGFSTGNSVFIQDVDSVFDGTYTITATPTTTSFTYTKTRNTPKTVSGAILVSNIATLTTTEAHGYILGENVTVSGIDSNYNGSYPIVRIDAPNTFSYALTRTNTKAITNKVMASDIATITMSTAHGFVVNENVLIADLDQTFDGVYKITSIPTTSTFTYNLVRDTVKSVSIRSLFSNVATLTLTEAHGFLPGEQVLVENVDQKYNGVYTITQIPSSNTFSYAKTSADETANSFSTDGTVKPVKRLVVAKQLIGGVVTLTTASAHGLFVGESITISSMGAPFDGSYTVSSIPNTNTFTYAKSSSNVSYGPAGAYIASRNRVGTLATIVTSAPHNLSPGQYATISNLDSNASSLNGTYSINVIDATTITYVVSGGSPVSLSTKSRTGSTATITSSGNHNFVNGQYVVIAGLGAPFDGGFTISVTGATTFTYPTGSSGDLATSSATSGTATSGIQTAAAPSSATLVGGYVAIPRNITSAADAGSASVGGSLPFTSISGSTVVPGDITGDGGGSLDSSGYAVKKTELAFTPGVTGASVDFGPDVLEVDTLTRDVYLNGSTDNARAKLDVLTDFFYLDPGQNQIEFVDTSEASSTALTKIFYRSGWLG
jgi:hypothetical protein